MTTTPGHPQHPLTDSAAPATAANPPTHTPTPKVREALEARDALATALTQAGIQLPAMDLRTYWADAREDGAQYALIYLGVCSAPVAHALADAIRKGLTR
jgi:hypothetical protein